MSSANIVYLLPLYKSFSFSCLITLARISKTTLNSSSKSRNYLLVWDLTGKPFVLPPLSILAIDVLSISVTYWNIFPLVLVFWEFLWSVEFGQMPFQQWLACVLLSFCQCVLLHWLEFFILDHPCILGTNPTQSSEIIPLLCFWIWSANILLGIFYL